MNIFVLDDDVKLAAQYHVDRHSVKMCLETAQILCSALRLKGIEKEWMYRLTHKNHPCVKWATESSANFCWLCEFGQQLCKEYTFRYGRTHKSEAVIEKCKVEICFNCPFDVKRGLTPFALAMPDQYKTNDPVVSYRNYYMGDKRHLSKWTKRNKPYWWR